MHICCLFWKLYWQKLCVKKQDVTSSDNEDFILNCLNNVWWSIVLITLWVVAYIVFWALSGIMLHCFAKIIGFSDGFLTMPISAMLIWMGWHLSDLDDLTYKSLFLNIHLLMDPMEIILQWDESLECLHSHILLYLGSTHHNNCSLYLTEPE